MDSSNYRQPSFVTLSNVRESDDLPNVSGVSVRSRLPASPVHGTSDLIDLTPSGEVQMRVMGVENTSLSNHTTPKLHSRNVEIQCNTQSENADESLNVEKLKHELAEHREAERRIASILECHLGDESCLGLSRGGGDSFVNNGVFPGLLDNGRRQQADLRGPHVDQCFGPGTYFPRQAPLNMRDGGCGSVRVNRNGCVDTMTFPDARNTNVGYGTERMYTSSSAVQVNNHNASNFALPNRPDDTQNKLKPKRPPTYDGSTSWQDLLVQFEMISVVNKWDNATKAYELATSMRGTAQGIVTDIEPEKRLDYNRLLTALTSRFEPENQANMYKSQLNSLFRKPGQTLPELGQEIRRITRLAYPTAPIEIRDQLAKDCFVRAINDSKIQLSIFQREPKTIDDCIRFGLDYEAFIAEQKTFNPRQGLRMQCEMEIPEEESLIVSHLNKMSKQIEQLNVNDKNKKRDMKCFYCGVKGHFKKDCNKFARDIRNNCVKSNKATKGSQGTQTDSRMGKSLGNQ